MPTNLIRCSACGLRPPEKLCQVTWAWMRADGQRTAYRQRLCVGCFTANLLVLDEDLTRDEPARCPGCHIDSEDNMDPVYATAYIPGSGKLSVALPSCPACAVEIRNRAQAGAVQLENREFPVEGPGPSTAPDSSDPWSRLGITPRA